MLNLAQALAESLVLYPRSESWSCRCPLDDFSQCSSSVLLSMYVPPTRAASPVFGFASGSFAAAFALAAGGGDGGLSAFFAGVFAATFAAAAWNVGYADAAAAAFAGGGVDGFAGDAAGRVGDGGFTGDAFAGFGGG